MYKEKLKQLILDKLVTIPHGHNPEDFYCQRKKDKDDGSNVSLSGDTNQLQGQNKKDEQMPAGVDNHADTFRFLANKGLRNMEDRGGIQYLIKAYLEEFKESDNTELILKINPAYGIPNLLLMFPELKNPDNPKITYITEEYTTKQMNELYNQCDVFVSPTRAEAFNIPCIEAMACGKPVITTDFGGQTDFVNNKNGWLLGYKLNQVTHEIEYESCMWATPDIKDLRSKLRGCFENKDDCERKGLISLEDAKKYTWENTAKMVLNLSL